MLVLKRLIKRNLFYDNLRQLNRQLVTILGLFFIIKQRYACYKNIQKSMICFVFRS